MAYWIRIRGYLTPKSALIPTTSVLAAAWKLTAWNKMLAISSCMTYSATHLPHPGPGSHQFSYLTRVCIQRGLSIPGHPSQKGLVVLWQQLWSPCYSRGLLRRGQIRVSVAPCVRVMFATLSFDGNTWPGQIQRHCGKALSKSMGKPEWKPEPLGQLTCYFVISHYAELILLSRQFPIWCFRLQMNCENVIMGSLLGIGRQ